MNGMMVTVPTNAAHDPSAPRIPNRLCQNPRNTTAALWGLWLFHIIRGEARTALALVDRFCGLVTDPIDRLRDQSLQLAERNVEDARTIDLAVGGCYALESASLVSIWNGDLQATERYVTALLDYSARQELAAWHRPARCYDGVRLIKRGDLRGGLELLRTALDELRETSFVPYYPFMLGTLAQGLAQAGYVAPALVTIDEALAKCERDEEGWWFAELLRIKAEVMLSAEDAAPLTSPDYGISKDRPRRRVTSWPRSTPASPRASPPPTSRPRRHSSAVSCNRPLHFALISEPVL